MIKLSLLGSKRRNELENLMPRGKNSRRTWRHVRRLIRGHLIPHLRLDLTRNFKQMYVASLILLYFF